MSTAAELHTELQLLLAEAKERGMIGRKKGLMRALNALEQEKKQKEVRRQHKLHQAIILKSVDACFLYPNVSGISQENHEASAALDDGSDLRLFTN